MLVLCLSLFYTQLVDSRIGIHLKHALAEEVGVCVRQVLNLGELSGDILLKCLAFFSCVFVGMLGIAAQHVECHKVVGV